MAKKRKIIQIAVNPHVPLDNDFAIFALCNDGSLWYGYIDGAFIKWKGGATDLPDDASPLSQLVHEARQSWDRGQRLARKPGNKALCDAIDIPF